ncbi:MAG: signal peptidase I [Clostridiales bacterium]|nr:signal peptidase I [Clostridiales bacterium]
MKKNSKLLEYAYDFAEILIYALVAILILFTFILKTSVINGESMENTLHNGENVLITAVNSDIKYGDVVVISQPNFYEKVLIKRVIATEGQTVSFNQETGKVEVDGVELKEDYIKDQNLLFIYQSMRKECVVPEGCVFVMGDNRNNSADSRDPNVGVIDKRYIIGKVFYKVGDRTLFEKDKFNA